MVFVWFVVFVGLFVLFFVFVWGLVWVWFVLVGLCCVLVGCLLCSLFFFWCVLRRNRELVFVGVLVVGVVWCVFSY